MLDWASAETFFAVGVGCMGMGMDGCSVSISVAFGRLQGRYPGGKFLFCFIAICVVLFCFALRGNLGHRHACVERRECRMDV